MDNVAFHAHEQRAVVYPPTGLWQTTQKVINPVSAQTALSMHQKVSGKEFALFYSLRENINYSNTGWPSLSVGLGSTDLIQYRSEGRSMYLLHVTGRDFG